jgi:hypothetical protein
MAKIWRRHARMDSESGDGNIILEQADIINSDALTTVSVFNRPSTASANGEPCLLTGVLTPRI